MLGVSIDIRRETNFLAIGVDRSWQNDSLISLFNVPCVFIEPVDCSKMGIIWFVPGILKKTKSHETRETNDCCLWRLWDIKGLVRSWKIDRNNYRRVFRSSIGWWWPLVWMPLATCARSYKNRAKHPTERIPIISETSKTSRGDSDSLLPGVLYYRKLEIGSVGALWIFNGMRRCHFMQFIRRLS